MAKKLQQRLVELAAANTLADMKGMPGHCHELTANRKGQLALDLIQPNRLVFKPSHNPVPPDAGGGLDWAKVTRIIVLEIVDYH